MNQAVGPIRHSPRNLAAESGSDRLSQVPEVQEMKPPATFKRGRSANPSSIARLTSGPIADPRQRTDVNPARNICLRGAHSMTEKTVVVVDLDAELQIHGFASLAAVLSAHTVFGEKTAGAMPQSVAGRRARDATDVAGRRSSANRYVSAFTNSAEDAAGLTGPGTIAARNPHS
ncbi:hypothetical protein NKJ64_16300 [Mesorhizobium sp. M0062]|uniref:hypothetical protein n=1 Tax=Mesorhizobium sp. M0062 TaxID=2956867 RepID=UPI00333A72A0